MLTKIEIENFKSIYKETIELGRVNVFIGENGCGKTNILEAVGMASAYSEGKIGNDELASKGLRVTKPLLTFSSFADETQNQKALVVCYLFDKELKTIIEQPYLFEANNPNDIFSHWKDIERETYVQEFHQKLSELILSGGMELTEDDKRSLLGDLYRTGHLGEYKIFHLSTDILRGIGGTSYEVPGIHGENLDILIASFSKTEFQELLRRAHFISWLEDVIIDREGSLRLEGHNLNLSTSKLYFRDKFMAKKNNIFSAENANEGILHVLFYIALFISKKTPKFFAIDNIETTLNPYLCRVLIEELVKLSKKYDKQVLITTHHPAVLDGLNLHDDEQRLFAVSRNLKGHTKVERIKLKPHAEVGGQRLKMSELWMRNYLGAQPQEIESL